MIRRIATALAIVGFVAASAAFACDYTPQTDAASSVPPEASKAPTVLACNKDCDVKPAPTASKAKARKSATTKPAALALGQ